MINGNKGAKTRWGHPRPLALERLLVTFRSITRGFVWALARRQMGRVETFGDNCQLMLWNRCILFPPPLSPVPSAVEDRSPTKDEDDEAVAWNTGT